VHFSQYLSILFLKAFLAEGIILTRMSGNYINAPDWTVKLDVVMRAIKKDIDGYWVIDCTKNR
jgi:hypothetical protein